MLSPSKLSYSESCERAIRTSKLFTELLALDGDPVNERILLEQALQYDLGQLTLEALRKKSTELGFTLVCLK